LSKTKKAKSTKRGRQELKFRLPTDAEFKAQLKKGRRMAGLAQHLVEVLERQGNLTKTNFIKKAGREGIGQSDARIIWSVFAGNAKSIG
jgi:hypothetical protein